jgi:hypothetical protein
MNHRDAEISDVVVVLDALEEAQRNAVVDQLKCLGMCVESVNGDSCTIEGCIESPKVSEVEKIQYVRYVRRVFSYTADYPVGDPRDLDKCEDESGEDED